MILFKISCGILVFSNFIISLLPNLDVVRNTNDLKLTNQFLFKVMMIKVSLFIAMILGMIGGYLHLLPLLLSPHNDEWSILISPCICVILFMTAFIRINFKVKTDK
ncbi:MAG: hypothetical protein K2Y14_01240 [Burkholderiales bacterium]|nr:hypothetical protein [Burkholderiales bacterium]